MGAITGFVFAGSLADFSAKFLTKRNDGIYEPEYRIVLVVAQAIVGVLGILPSHTRRLPVSGQRLIQKGL